MTQRVNHRRGSKRRQDHGPGWESHTPSAGSNSTHVARARTKAKRRASRVERRTGEFDRASARRWTRADMPEANPPILILHAADGGVWLLNQTGRTQDVLVLEGSPQAAAVTSQPVWPIAAGFIAMALLLALAVYAIWVASRRS